MKVAITLKQDQRINVDTREQRDGERAIMGLGNVLSAEGIIKAIAAFVENNALAILNDAHTTDDPNSQQVTLEFDMPAWMLSQVID